MATESAYSIAILLPTRGRTDSLDRSVISIMNRAVDPDSIQILFAFDTDDTVGQEHFTRSVQPWLDLKGIAYEAVLFEPLGYIRLNEYLNALALRADADWVFFWNDDAIMDTAGWDRVIASHTGEFKILSVHANRDHPYSIFPIVPRAWIDTLGYLSPHQINDCWISQQAYLLDVYERIPVWVTHDRADLTGNNDDETYRNRPMLEGNPSDPRDFHHLRWYMRRMTDCDTLADYMKSQGLDTTWWEQVKAGKQDPWVKLRENDPNDQCKSWHVSYDLGPQAQ
jgi:hypothetical protein